MGVPVTTIKQFEENAKHSRNNWIMIIFANAASDSKAVEYVLRNFHEMDTFSGEIDFYLPGYDIYNLHYDGPPEELELRYSEDLKWRNTILTEEYQDYHGEFSYGFGVLNLVERKRTFIRAIDSPRIGPVLFNEAEFTDFIMEFNRKNQGYNYMGTCQMNLVPLTNGFPDYSRIRSYDLDTIVDCPSGPSLDSFFHHVIHAIRASNQYSRLSLLDRIMRRRDRVLVEIDRLYEAATSLRQDDDKYEIIINNIIVDMERCLQWSLQEEYFFISYSSKNVLKAAMIGRLIQDHGHHVWIAPDGIPQGREYSLVVPTALKLARHFVLLLTPESAKSNWVKRELDIAISNEANTKVKVLLADNYSIDDIRRDNELMFYLNRVQVKYRYEDIVRDQYQLKQFISE